MTAAPRKATSGAVSPGEGFADGVRTGLRVVRGAGRRNALSLFHAQLSVLIRHPVDPAELEPWAAYRTLLDEDEVTTKVVDQLQILWEAAARERDEQFSQRRFTPVVLTELHEMQADTAAEFIEVLKLLVSRSGVTATGIGKRAPDFGPGKLNCSQVHSLLKRGVLPRKGEQVRSFGEACGLDQTQLQQLLSVWASLSMRRGSDAAEDVVRTERMSATRSTGLVSRKPMHTHHGDMTADEAMEALTAWSTRVPMSPAMNFEAIKVAVAVVIEEAMTNVLRSSKPPE